MLEETNKALLRRFVEELMNQGNMAVAPELVAPTSSSLIPSLHSIQFLEYPTEIVLLVVLWRLPRIAQRGVTSHEPA